MESVVVSDRNFCTKKYFEININGQIKNIENDIIVVENAGNILNIRMLYSYELNQLQVGDSIELCLMLNGMSFYERNRNMEVKLN